MTNEALINNIWAAAGLHSNELHEWRAELLRRLGAAVSPCPTLPDKCDCGHKWHGDDACQWEGREEDTELHCTCPESHRTLTSKDFQSVSAHPQPRWLPIETAPKDGRHIQAANFSGKDFGRDIGFGSGQSYQCVVHWWQWCDGTHQEEWGWYPSTGAGESDALTTLTHWKPLEEFFAAAPAQEPRICTCPKTQWIGSEPNDSTCELTEEEHRQLAAAQEQPVENPMLKGKP